MLFKKKRGNIHEEHKHESLLFMKKQITFLRNTVFRQITEVFVISEITGNVPEKHNVQTDNVNLCYS
jgi:hypothetical protein